MSKSFLTVEDVNGGIFNNQKGFLYEIPLQLSTEEFSDVHFDFCKVSRSKSESNYTYIIEVNNSYWNGEYYFKRANGTYINMNGIWINNKLHLITSYNDIIFVVYLNNLNTSFSVRRITDIPYPFDINHKATLKDIDKWVTHNVMNLASNSITPGTIHLKKDLFDWSLNGVYFYYVGTLIKSDFQFDCTQSLVLGKVNTVRLGASADYKPNGDMIGTNTPTIVVLYGSTYIPVRFDSSLNDYVFDIDLTNKGTEGKLRLKVFVESNDVLNATETDIALDSNFELINNESKLKTLFKNGGIGRLGANITLTSDITVDNDVLIIGNAKTINMANHKFIVPSEKTFKTENTIFTNGKNTIQQNIGSTVELTSCGFTACTGFGSVIDCQTDLSSLTVENDFITNITNCVFANNDMCILHGGELNITNCDVTGKISNPNNPYFLYQTDGEATILQSKFQLSSDSQIESDIEFNSCIFSCGETAMINGNNHDELQSNNITSFISNPQNNTSTINVTYYYPAIEDYITLESEKGYCHSCSNVDYVFKNNVTVRRD